MVARGEMTTEEAKRMVDEMVSRAQQAPPSTPDSKPTEPRRIEILVEDEPAAEPEAVENLRQEVEKLQAELRRLRKE